MDYKGIIIEESLENKDVLKDVRVLKTEIFPVEEKDKTPWIKQWTLHTIEIAEDKIGDVCDKISKSIDRGHANAWYADFDDENFHYIVFFDKVFKINKMNKDEYAAVLEYGRSLGIPEHQLDFE